MSRDDDSQTEWYPFYGKPDEAKARPRAKRARKPSQQLPQSPTAGNESQPPTGYVHGMKDFIKKAVVEDRDITLEQLEQRIRKLGAKVTRVTVSGIRTETRHTLALLDRLGWLRNRPRR